MGYCLFSHAFRLDKGKRSSLFLFRCGCRKATELSIRSLEICRNGGNILFELWVLPVLAELYLKTGQPDKAAQCVQRGFELLKSDQSWYGLPGPMYLAKGLLASEQKRWDEAVECFAEAVAVNRQYELPWDEAKTLFEWGLMHMSRGTEADVTKACEKLDQAQAIFERIGAKKYVEKVRVKKEMLGPCADANKER